MVAVAILIYYILPAKFRWIALLASSGVFLFSAGGWKQAAMAIGIVLWTYLAALLIDRYKEKSKISKAILAVAVVSLVGSLLFLKEQIFFVNSGNKILGALGAGMSLSVYQVAAPIGLSYFVLTLISYVCEVYWGTVEVQKNPFRFLTYGLYFPILTSGPILKYNDTSKELFEAKSFDYTRFCFGVQRILWGFFKKIVISERLSVYVTAVYSDSNTFNGLYVPLAAMAFILQLYTDFSGCIDIIMGVSSLFGVELPENFNFPFYSKTLSEFWRRWHITLGGWLKEYILYPILKSGLCQKYGSVCREKFGKKKGKKIPTWTALIIAWFLIGLWHGGGYNYIFGIGLYMGIVIVLSEILEPAFAKIKQLLRINDQTFSWSLFQMIRTFLLAAFGISFFRADSLSSGFGMWKNAFAVWNPWILFADPVDELGLSTEDYRVLQVSILVLLVTAVISIREKKSIRELVAKQNIVFRWLVWIVPLFAVVLYGKYGPGYSAAEFIYKGF